MNHTDAIAAIREALFTDADDGRNLHSKAEAALGYLEGAMESWSRYADQKEINEAGMEKEISDLKTIVQHNKWFAERRDEEVGRLQPVALQAKRMLGLWNDTGYVDPREWDLLRLHLEAREGGA